MLILSFSMRYCWFCMSLWLFSPLLSAYRLRVPHTLSVYSSLSPIRTNTRTLARLRRPSTSRAALRERQIEQIEKQIQMQMQIETDTDRDTDTDTERDRDTNRDRDSEAPVLVRNTQRKHALDLDEVRRDVRLVRSILGAKDFEVEVWLCSEAKIRELNGMHRGKSRSTDVLSFAVQSFTSPEVFKRFPLQHEKYLGDIVISPDFVFRQCERDRKEALNRDFEYHKDRGVSGAMSDKFTVQERIPHLIIHSLLHLLGHDHEEDEEWEVMVQREEEVLHAYERERAQSLIKNS